MTLPGLGNFVAAFATDAGRHAELRRRLGGIFSRLDEPYPGWCLGCAPLPDSPWPMLGGLVLAEGGELHDAPGEGSVLTHLVSEDPTQLARFDRELTGALLLPGGRAVAFRSPGGRVPVYVITHPVLVIATRIDHVVRALGDGVQPDLLGVALAASGFSALPDRRTTVQGTRVLRRGSWTRVEPSSSVSIRRFWTPAAQPIAHGATQAELAKELEHALLQAMERQMDGRGDAFLVSGGIDSALLLALGTRGLDRKASTLSALVPRPADQRWQRSLLDAAASRANVVARHEQHLSVQWFLDTVAQRSPTAAPSWTSYGEQVARLAPDAKFGTVVCGTFADECFGGRGRRDVDWFHDASILDILLKPPASTGRRPWRAFRRRVALALGRTALTGMGPALADMFRPMLREEYATWYRTACRKVAFDTRPNAALLAYLDADGWLLDRWEGFTPRGIRPFSPFATRAVVELAARCPPSVLAGVTPKPLVQRCATPWVAPTVLQQPIDRPWERGPDPHLRASPVAASAELARLASLGETPVLHDVLRAARAMNILDALRIPG